MSKPLLERIPFGKIVAAQAILFGIAMGLCRLDAHMTEHGQKLSRTMDETVFLTSLMQLGVITLTGIGIVVSLVLWLAAAIVSAFRARAAHAQKAAGDAEG
jgi:hypothetical protein